MGKLDMPDPNSWGNEMVGQNLLAVEIREGSEDHFQTDNEPYLKSIATSDLLRTGLSVKVTSPSYGDAGVGTIVEVHPSDE